MDKLSVVVGHTSPDGQTAANKLAGYRRRLVTLADLPALEQLGEAEHFQIGLENLQLYFKTSPNCWYLIENSNGEVVAYDSANNMSNGVNFGFQIIVREDLRGIGLTRLFPKFQGRIHAGNATEYSILRWKFHTWHWRLVGFWGMPNVQEAKKWLNRNDMTVKPLTKNDLPDLVKYDKGVVKVERKFFLSQWCYADGNVEVVTTVVARNPKGKVVGYGTLRKTAEFFTLSPLYADTDAVAKAIVAELVAPMSLGQHVYFKCLASNRQMLSCAHELGLIQTETEMQHYFEEAEKYITSVNWSQVFCVHEFWPV